MKTCKSGQYYCTKDKKCKPIPGGYHVGRGGWLEKDDDSKKKNGNGNGNGSSHGNGNGSNGNGNGGNGSSGNGNGGGNGGGVSEEIEVSNWRDDFTPTEYESIDLIKPDPIVVEEPTVEWEDPTLTEAQRIQSRVGNIIRVFLRWKGRMFMLQMFFPQLKKPNRTDVIAQIQKVYPGSKLLSYDIEDYDPSEPMIQVSEGSLHKWFKGSKSKDGKPGWVNVKTGGTCASDEPGEGTPKCVSSSKRASMTKAERDSASRRKKAADPGQQSKTGAAKPTYVSTDKPKKKVNEDKVLKTVAKELAGASKMHKGQSEKIKKHLKDMKKVDEACWKGYKAYGMKKKGNKMVPNCKPVGSVKEETVDEACWKGYEKKGMKTMFGKRYPNCVKKTRKEEKDWIQGAVKRPGAFTKKANAADMSVQQFAKHVDDNPNKYSTRTKKQANLAQTFSKMKKEEVEIAESDKKGKGSGTKDACYHKVKSRYSVWPSAYASGALVKCRKKGAANWGNSSKKESYSWRDDFEYVLEGAAWTKKEGKKESGGLNEKGRKSYERENPGSDLKAPSKKVGNKRRASFCARMKGMRKRQKPSNNTGDDRLSKSLRAWNC